MHAHRAVSRTLSSLLILVMLVAMQPLTASAAVSTLAQQVQATMIPATMAPQSTRTAGSDRFGTNVELSQQGWLTSEHVVIASGRDWPDAMVGGSLASALDAPVCLPSRTGCPRWWPRRSRA